MMRTFIAVAVTEPNLVGALQAVQKGPGVKWVAPHQFHFTFKFLGEIDAALVPTIQSKLDQVAAAVAPFALELRGLGAFPHQQRPRVLWAGAGVGREQLVELAERVEEALADRFAPAERPFRPHLTLGRPRTAAVDPGWFAQPAAFGVTQVTEILLVKSELGPGGPRYTLLHRAPLLDKA